MIPALPAVAKTHDPLKSAQSPRRACVAASTMSAVIITFG